MQPVRGTAEEEHHVSLDLAELVAFVGAALTPAAYFAGRFLRLARRVPLVTPPDHCVGYRRDHSTSMQQDCKALRSPTCIDGRCSFHCKDMCKC